MSLLTRAHRPKHRAADALAEARATEQQLRAALADAGRTVADLKHRLDRATRHQAEAEMTVISQQADIDDLRVENDELRGQLWAIAHKFGDQLAAEANAQAVTVPAWVRDTSDPADQATQPIPVMALWDRKENV